MLNEDEIIDLAGRLFDREGPGVITGVGDDAAVIKAGGETWLWAADMLVEGIHFQRPWTPPQDLGRKALAVNLSDMAAMGGEGGYALFSAALPDGLDSAWVEDLFGGLAGFLDCLIGFTLHGLDGLLGFIFSGITPANQQCRDRRHEPSALTNPEHPLFPFHTGNVVVAVDTPRGLHLCIGHWPAKNASLPR